MQLLIAKMFPSKQSTKTLPTNSWLGHTSKALKIFCHQMCVKHKTGIPYNPQGQEIVEYTHGALKTQQEKNKKGELYSQWPHNILNHAFFSLNF